MLQASWYLGALCWGPEFQQLPSEDPPVQGLSVPVGGAQNFLDAASEPPQEKLGLGRPMQPAQSMERALQC